MSAALDGVIAAETDIPAGVVNVLTSSAVEVSGACPQRSGRVDAPGRESIETYVLRRECLNGRSTIFQSIHSRKADADLEDGAS
jgi:hypothetical protein